VLGYFDASTIQEKQLFVSNLDVSRMTYPASDLSCDSVEVSYDMINEFILNGWMLVIQRKSPGGLKYIMAPPECVDCRLTGSNVKPDYWQE